MTPPLIVSLCDLTGNAVRPWAEAGCECVCLDVQHSIRADRTEVVGAGRITYRWADVRSVTWEDFDRRPAFVFAWPPCTHLAVSGARDFQRKGLRLLIDALELVEACRLLCEMSGAPWMLENPVGRLSSCWREPDHTFDPCDYGDPYTKRTCLWTGGGFVMPPPSCRGRRHALGRHRRRARAGGAHGGQQDAPHDRRPRRRQQAQRDADGIRPRRLRRQPPPSPGACRMTAPERTPDAPRAPLHRSYSRLWALIIGAGVLLEAIALARRGDGDTLSAHVWTLVTAWPGLLAFLGLGWAPMHFIFGRGQPLGRWYDYAGLALGVAYWLLARRVHGAAWP